MATVVREIERKYEAEGRPGPPDLTRTRGVASVEDRGRTALDATYYDTAGLALAAAGVTLRRRTGGDDAGWHLKLPAGTDARDEIRLPPRTSHEVPAHLARLVRAHTRDAPLVPVVRLRSLRTVRHLVDGDGGLLAEVSYDEVEAELLDHGGERPAESWAEIEVELAEGGDPAFLDAVEKRLSKAGVGRSDSPSKLARALGERLVRARERRSSGGCRARPGSAGEAVLGYLREHARALVAVDAAVRRDQPDSVHRMRVAARRMRSALSTFRTVLDRDATRPLADELRWLGGELGADRDREVLTERLYALVEELPRGSVLGPVRGRLRIWSARRRAVTRKRVLAALNSRRYLDLLAALDALLDGPPVLPGADRPAGRVLAKAVRRDYRRLAARVAAASGDEERHEARKAAKRVRYAAEAARPVLGRPAKVFASRMKAVQEVLGEYQDGVVAREALRDLALQAHRGGENTFTYGILFERETRHSQTASAAFGAVWEEASRPEHREGFAV